MSIKPFVLRSDLISRLRNRGLIFDEQELENTIQQINYYELFNGLENLFLSTTNPKKYSKVTLTDFLALHAFDKLLSQEIFQALSKLESALKTSIAYHFTKQYCSTIINTMQYTNSDNYMNPAVTSPSHPNYCPFSSTYAFKREHNQKVFNSFNTFMLFQPFYLTNLINLNEDIEKSFYTDSSYIAPS